VTAHQSGRIDAELVVRPEDNERVSLAVVVELGHALIHYVLLMHLLLQNVC
jgi:hypothetical protein